MSSLKQRRALDRGASSSVDPERSRCSRDPWKKRRSLLASDRASGIVAGKSTWSLRRVPSSASLASFSDTDTGRHSPAVALSQSHNLLKVFFVCFVAAWCVQVLENHAVENGHFPCLKVRKISHE